MTGYGNQPISQQAAKELLALPLEDKVVLSREKIEQWYDAWGGKCYVSFSGGKDSTALAYLAAQELSRYRTPIYPLTLVFVNTGLEYPEIQHFVNDYAVWLQRQFPRIEVQLVRLRPKLNIRQVLTRYGYPVIGKKQARFIRDLQNAHGQNDATVNLHLTGYNRQGVYCSTMKLADKWHYLKDAPFRISEQCCDVMKKAPTKRYNATSGCVPFTAMMASESQQREKEWKRTGCNAFEGKRPMSKPMSFWAEQDVLHYEATGLTPRGVEILKEEKLSSDGMILLGRLMGKKLHEIGCERLRELVEADADGRAITLPCKLGGEVWAPGCGRTVKLRVVEEALLLQGEDGEGYEKLSDFGKTFFATKEGAEEAKRNEWFT